jgi:hypothetical protein
MRGIVGPPQKELLMSLDELKVELKDLEFIKGVEIERHISEGKHQGESAVVACSTKCSLYY